MSVVDLEDTSDRALLAVVAAVALLVFLVAVLPLPWQATTLRAAGYSLFTFAALVWHVVLDDAFTGE